MNNKKIPVFNRGSLFPQCLSSSYNLNNEYIHASHGFHENAPKENIRTERIFPCMII